MRLRRKRACCLDANDLALILLAAFLLSDGAGVLVERYTRPKGRG